MAVTVSRVDGVHRLAGDVALVEIGNRWLTHLEARQFSPATVRGYAYDLVCLARFLDDVDLAWNELSPSDVFDWLDWQGRRTPRASDRKVVPLAKARGAAPATMNRRVAAARGLFEYALMCGMVPVNPVPAPRRSSGLRARRGLLGHVRSRRPAAPARLVRQERRLPDSLDVADVEVFMADLNTHRDRAMALAMVAGGLRASEVRSLRLADVDMGMRQVKVTGKGAKQRIVPIDRAFFAEVRAYLDGERPRGVATPECFVVLRGPTAGQRLTEAGLRKIFRVHRARTGATRVRPHRLRHTFGTELATAGIDLLVLRELMGHAHVETTAAYVHLAPETIAAEWARTRQVDR